MKCDKCSYEWSTKSGQSVNFCPNCGGKLQFSKDISTENVIKSLVIEYGENILLDANLYSFVADMLHNKSPKLLKRLRLAISENVPQIIYAIKNINLQDRFLRIKVIVDSLKDDFNMSDDLAYELVNYFSVALGFQARETPEELSKTPNSPSPDSSSTSQTSKSLSTPHNQQIQIKENAIKIGNIIRFGDNDWRVLNIKDEMVLLLSEKILEKRHFHYQYTDITWSVCELRDYLNGEEIYSGRGFYDSFSLQEKAQIAETKIITNDNPWFGTRGGSISSDKIFLLSIEEVVKYFGDSGQIQNPKPIPDYYIADTYNQNRVAFDKSGATKWWWLRSPGSVAKRTAYVSTGGLLIISGYDVNNMNAGVRPALWIKLSKRDSSILDSSTFTTLPSHVNQTSTFTPSSSSTIQQKHYKIVTKEEAYKIGDIGPAGGYIFYDMGNHVHGWRYLEVAPASSEIYSEWGVYGITCFDTSNTIGTGKANTVAITKHINEYNKSKCAAYLCETLTINGYCDWFLPSKDELVAMYENLCKRKNLGGFNISGKWPLGWYWSSSVFGNTSSTFTWCMRFSDGDQANYSNDLYRGSKLIVRGIRAF